VAVAVGVAVGSGVSVGVDSGVPVEVAVAVAFDSLGCPPKQPAARGVRATRKARRSMTDPPGPYQ
jgi:hypothetical protein